MVEAFLNVKGLTCRRCVDEVEGAVTNINGVERAMIDLADSKLFIEYNENETGMNEIKSAVTSAGYLIE
ncbi:heavy-metal-associated domain-containing protein [Paenibacillus turpanensis]|uniref:heavy-metal-associated domain-containing protein n=1 Tax=Paenibacillus turpanensis TaxID=2689078 RepID=UPI001408C48A|nr:heavy metal-associated domain-containing protein [Paenibacillus turpanensis]